MFHLIIKALLLVFVFNLNADIDTAYIVQLKEDTEKQKILNEGIDGRQVRIIREYDSINAILVEFTDGLEVDADIEDENIQSITKDRIIQWINPIESDDLEVDGVENGLKSSPFGISRIGAEVFPFHKNVDATIAIIDTGIDSKHKSLNVVKEINFVQGESSADGNGHGTHVAGIAAGKRNGAGFIGVAPGAKLIALKVLNTAGSGLISDIIGAIDWVTMHSQEVDVVNMSLGSVRGNGRIDLMHEAIKKSVAKGVIYIVAAGNEGENIYYGDNNARNSVPAAYPEVMTVSAMVSTDGVPGGLGPDTMNGADDKLAGFSNYSYLTNLNNPVASPGACIDVAAPGVDILSTFPGNQFKKLSGTSMASPHVAGVVARYIAKNRKVLFEHGKKSAEVVYQIRQKFIDEAEPQEVWNLDGDANDPDPNHEGLIRIIE